MRTTPLWVAAALVVPAALAWVVLGSGGGTHARDPARLAALDVSDVAAPPSGMRLEPSPSRGEERPLEAVRTTPSREGDGSSAAHADGSEDDAASDDPDVALRVVALRVVDELGAPIVGAVVRFRDPEDELFPGSGHRATGPAGAVRVRVPLESDEWVLAAAPGRHAAWAALPAGSEEPRQIALRPAGELVVRVTMPDGGVLEQASVLVVARGGPLAAPDAIDAPVDPALDEAVARDVGASVPRRRSERPDGRAVAFAPGDDGTLLVHDVLPVPLRVELVDRWDQLVDAVDDVRVPPGERVEVELSGEVEGARNLRVDVRGPDGRPLSGARVWLTTSGERAFGGRTSPDGAVVFPGLRSERVTLGVEHPGCLPYHAEAEVSRGALVVQLERAQRVEVQLVDVHGGELPAESLTASWTSGGVTVTDRPIESSCSAEGYACAFEQLPAGEIELTAHVGGRVFRRVHDTRLGALRWELPCHGALELRPPRALADGRLVRVDLDELDAAGALVQHSTRSLHVDDEGAALVLPAVLAGRYRVRLSAFDRDASDFVPASAWAPVDVRAHQTNVVRLDDVP